MLSASLFAAGSPTLAACRSKKLAAIPLHRLWGTSAPARGRVEYVTDVEIVLPRDAAKSNGVLLFNITHRGNKGALALFNADIALNIARIYALQDAGDGFCSLQGSFIPFAATRAERVAAGDPRLSLEERYPDRASYVAAIRKAASDLVARRHLLATDAARLIAEAERDGWSNRP